MDVVVWELDVVLSEEVEKELTARAEMEVEKV
jgi:hypothetical protein